MALYDEDEVRRKNEKDRKLKKYILISIIISTISIIVLMIVIFYLIYNPNKITISLDGNKTTKLDKVFVYEKDDDGNTIIYTPIIDIADTFKYTSGEGTPNYQDENSCYVQNDNEVVIFTLDSNIIYKKDKTTNNNNSDYEYIKINNPIKKINEKLYIDQDGLQKAFNIYMNYNSKTKKITIQRLEYLIDIAQKIAKNKGYEMDTKFVNQKAVLDGLIVVNSKDRLKGVIDASGEKDILRGIKYNDITYIPQKDAFFVKSTDGKVGIIGKDGETKINFNYSNLTLIDNENDLYLAQSATTRTFWSHRYK